MIKGSGESEARKIRGGTSEVPDTGDEGKSGVRKLLKLMEMTRP